MLCTEFEKTLDVNSKWYLQDLADFKKRAAYSDLKKLPQQLANLQALNNSKSSFTKTVNKEIKKLDAAGMFIAENLNPKNALL